MCYSAMQAQAAKNDLMGLRFYARVQIDYGETMIFPLGKMAFGRLSPEDGAREALLGQFGLVPPWIADDKDGPKFGRNCYNARSETLFEKPSFKESIRLHRAVIPATAFFEFPDHEKPVKHRYKVTRRDKGSFWFAGLWAYNKKYDLTSCSIITTEPMDLVSKFHSRSPVILDESQLEAWLDPALKDKGGIEPFLRPHSSEGFELEIEDWEAVRKKRT
jgi:putative SOS response-associated peptidase YedK